MPLELGPHVCASVQPCHADGVCNRHKLFRPATACMLYGHVLLLVSRLRTAGVGGALLLAAVALVAAVWLARRRQSNARAVLECEQGIPNLLAMYPGAAGSSTKG